MPAPRGRPSFVTDRLMLTPMDWDHLFDLAALDEDPDVMRYLGGPRSSEQVRAKMPDRLSPTDDALGLGFWVGHERRAFVGWWCLSLEGPGLAEIGWRLHTFAWGRGLATEAAEALLDHGFSTVGLDRVMAQTLSVNAASRGVMRKLGMTHQDTEPVAATDPEARSEGAEEGVVRYEITRSQWEALLRARESAPAR